MVCDGRRRDVCVTSGGASVRSGTPDSVSSTGSARQQPQPQYQYAGQPGYQHSHAVPGQSVTGTHSLTPYHSEVRFGRM